MFLCIANPFFLVCILSDFAPLQLPSFKWCLQALPLGSGELTAQDTLVSRGVGEIWEHQPTLLGKLWVVGDFFKSTESVKAPTPWLCTPIYTNQISCIHSLEPPVHSMHRCRTNFPKSPISSHHSITPNTFSTSHHIGSKCFHPLPDSTSCSLLLGKHLPF